jgi:hypothetical protein
LALDNYGELATAVGDMTNRTDLGAYVPDFVVLAEARIRRSDVERTTDLELTLAAAEVSLPVDFKRMNALYYQGGSRYGDIDLVPINRLAEYSRDGVSGIPLAAAILQSGDTSYKLRVSPAPDSATAYVVRAEYVQTFTPLDPANSASTNWILTSYPDVYLYGALCETAPFLKDDERLPMWDKRFTSALEELRIALHKQKWAGSPKTVRPRRALGE